MARGFFRFFFSLSHVMLCCFDDPQKYPQIPDIPPARYAWLPLDEDSALLAQVLPPLGARRGKYPRTPTFDASDFTPSVPSTPVYARLLTYKIKLPKGEYLDSTP